MDEVVFEPFPDSKLLGAVRAVCGIKDAAVIIHGKSCCHSDSLLFETLTGSQHDIRVFGSGIRTQDISVGGYRKLSLAIRSVYKEFKPKLIVVLVTSFTALMGDDVDGIIEDLKKEIPCKIISLFCPGFLGDSKDGYSEVLKILVDHMDKRETQDKSINILGFKRDDPHADSDLNELKRLLQNHNIKLNKVLIDILFSDLKDVTKAALNVVISEDGLECAKLLEERFDIPYTIVPYPYGFYNSIEFLDKITKFFRSKTDQDVLNAEKTYIKNMI